MVGVLIVWGVRDKRKAPNIQYRKHSHTLFVCTESSEMQPEVKVRDLTCHHAILNVQRRKQKLNYFLHEMTDLEFQKFAFF